MVVTQDSQVKKSDSESSKSGEMMVMDDGSMMSDVLSAVTRPHEEENKRPVQEEAVPIAEEEDEEGSPRGSIDGDQEDEEPDALKAARKKAMKERRTTQRNAETG